MRKQQEARERVLDLIESLAVGEAIPSERRLSTDLDPALLDALTNTIGLSDVTDAAPRVLDGRIRGRLVVDTNR